MTFRKSACAMALALSGITVFTVAQADLVFDDETGGAPTNQVQERDQLRKVYKATQQVETANEIATDTTVSTAPVVSEAPALSRSELLRRKRIREEMKNEDLLTQRLEELRLREEEKRTKKLLKTSGLEEEDEQSVKMSPAPVVEEAVVAPITEKPGSEMNSMQMAPAPAPQMQVSQYQPVASDRIGVSQSATMSSTVDAAPAARSGEGMITVSPRFGFASISNDYYEFDSKYAAGLGVGFGVSDYLSVELGYTYARSSMSLANAYNPYSRFQEMIYNQNIFDLGLKLGFVGPDSKVRPYVSGGAGYSMGYLNYDQRTQDYTRYSWGMNAQDYELNQIIGTLGGGLEFKVGQKATIGVGYKLIAPLSSSENQQFWNYALGADPVKDQVRGSLRDSTTHMFLVSGGFSF